tara:strand:- start:1191 stop:1586 length:396 start_codon:yes stop_codon:yes gene_type:complete
MPSIRKRIGYLPSNNIQEIISRIAKKENLSQSKVVGILVEEALIARGDFDLQNKDNLTRTSIYGKANNINNSSLKYSELDELISDKGITYNRKKDFQKSENLLGQSREDYNPELFELFKQFILFQKMIEEK